MAKTGYLFLAKGYKAREEDIAWMKEFGCDSIVIEEGIKERLSILIRCRILSSSRAPSMRERKQSDNTVPVS